MELGNSAKTSETSVAATATPVNNYAAPAATANSAATSGGLVLSNGNTAGATGSYAASRMAEMTGVPASTWEAIIARESNGQVDAYNPSGASGLFQTMPGWGIKQLLLMIKFNQPIAPIVLKDFQLGVTKIKIRKPQKLCGFLVYKKLTIYKQKMIV